MTEHDREEEISRRYRELAREEPSRALDDAILAAARRELETRPAPLVAPSGRRRWAVPIAAAAVIVLSAVVTLHVQREQPDAELSAPAYAPPATRKDEIAAKREDVPREQMVAPATRADADTAGERAAEAIKSQALARRSESAPLPVKPKQSASASAAVAVPTPAPAPDLAASALPKPPADPGRFSPDPAPAAALPPPMSQMQMRPVAPAAKPAPRAAESASSGAAAGPPVAAEEREPLGSLRDSTRMREDAGALAKRAEPSESPERMLERVAALRREGRQKEADDLYAEFKRRFPGYRIPQALRDQVLPR